MASAVKESEYSAPTISGQELAWKVWHHRRWLAKVTGVGLAVATIVAFVIPKQYESTVQIMPPEPQVSATSMLAGLTGLGAVGAATGGASSLLTGRTLGATYVAMVGSRTVCDDLINRFDLRRVYGTRRYIDARKQLARRTKASEDRKSGIITITVTDDSPGRARDMAAAYAEDLDKLLNQLSTSSARRQRVFLEQRLKTVGEDLDASARALGQFSSRNATIDLQSQGKATLDAAARIQGELIAARSELQGAEKIYGDSHVRIIAQRARVAALERELRKMSGADEQADAADLRADQLYPSLRKLPLLSVTYADLYRRARLQEAIFEILTKQCEIARVEEAKEIPSLKILDAPVVPEQKSFPPRLLVMAFGVFLAFGGGIAWLAARKAFRQMNDSDPAKLLLVEVWSSLPVVGKLGHGRRVDTGR